MTLAQLCRYLFFPDFGDSAAREKFDEQAAQGVGGEFADEFSAFGDADVAGFLRHDNDDGVALLAHADGGTMAAAQLAFQFAAFGQGKLHAGEGDASLADHHAQIVQRAVRPEDRVEQIGGEIGVDARGAFGKADEADFALDGDQAADFRRERKVADSTSCSMSSLIC